MSWRLTTTAAIVLALASTLTTGVQAGTLEQDTPEWERYWTQLRRMYNRVKTADIAYEPSGTRSRFVGEINPPFVTPDPDQVEVIAFITYGNEAWITNYVLMTKWAKTLPSDVTVHYLPKKSLWQTNPHPRAQPLRAVRQNLYHTALAMGVPSSRAHHAVAFFVTRDVWALENTQSQRRYARRLKLDADEFQATREHPAVGFEGQVANWIERAHVTEKWRIAKNVAGVAERSRYTHFPELLIGGKYIVSTSLRRKPIESYQMANWAIGQSLEDLDANRHWPRNTEELAAWLTPRDKQILSRRVNGAETEDFPAGVVYEADKQRLWLLNADGGIRAIAKLTRTDDGSTHFVYEKNGQTEVLRYVARHPPARAMDTPRRNPATLRCIPARRSTPARERPERTAQARTAPDRHRSLEGEDPRQRQGNRGPRNEHRRGPMDDKERLRGADDKRRSNPALGTSSDRHRHLQRPA